MGYNVRNLIVFIEILLLKLVTYYSTDYISWCSTNVMSSSRKPIPTPICRPSISPTVEKLLLEIEGQAVKTQAKYAVQPKNYAKENFRKLKEIQDGRKKDVSIRTPTKAFPLQSNVANTAEKNDHCETLPVTAPKGATIKPTLKVYESKKAVINFNKNEKLLQRSASHQSLIPIVEPKISPEKFCLRRSPSFKDTRSLREEFKPQLPHSLGTMPKYLIARKQKWKEEAEQKQKAAFDAKSGIPPGHTLMSNEERLETLKLLEKTRNELLQKLISLPVHLSTIRSRNLKDELETQLTKAEEGIKIFSRSRVLIKHDE